MQVCINETYVQDAIACDLRPPQMQYCAVWPALAQHAALDVQLEALSSNLSILSCVLIASSFDWCALIKSTPQVVTALSSSSPMHVTQAERCGGH